MSEYQVIARKFRPQSFKDVLGQEAIITTLVNAIKFKRLAQAYLFCGSRGTGKTTLARILAKALNCQHPSENFEPCNECASCQEIISGASLDVLEIDGASHRGIEDIRQINETVGYAAASGAYKIYIIDEVHMLTKEAFNALLKTLEEPPPKVKFFFATTEPHKVPSTIMSRCQRFNLNRIPLQHIIAKLKYIADQLNVEAEEEALLLLAQRAEGGLRDAESLFDQILAFEEGPITQASVTSILGMMPRDTYFEIDRAGKEGRLIKAFDIAHSVFAEGKDLTYFVEGLIDHLRLILLFKLSGRNSSLFILTETEKDRYEETCQFYSQEQCLDLIEYLLEAQNQLRLSAFGKISLETILLHVMRSHFRLPIEQLVRKLSELESLLQEKENGNEQTEKNTGQEQERLEVIPAAQPTVLSSAPSTIVQTPSLKTAPITAKASEPPPLPQSTPSKPLPEGPPSLPSISEDPTPTPADLGKKTSATKPNKAEPPSTQPVPDQKQQTEPALPLHKYDTLFHFAAVELEGKLQKK